MKTRERNIWRHAGSDFSARDLLEALRHAGRVDDDVRVRVTREGFEVYRVESFDEALEGFRLDDGSDPRLLESLDTDGSVLGIPLKLNEGCNLEFDKHMDDIIQTQQDASDRQMRQLKSSESSQQRDFDKRYRDHARNRIRYKG